MLLKVRSLRLWFGLAGGAGTAACVAGLAFHRSTVFSSAIASLDWLLAASLSTAALYAAFNLPRLLRTRLKTVVAVLDVCRIRLVVGFVVGVFQKEHTPSGAAGTVLGFILGMLVAGYVKRNVIRLGTKGWPPSTERPRWWGYLLAATVGVAPFCAMAGLRHYIFTTKSHEARAALPAFAKGMASCSARRASDPSLPQGLPATSEAVPRTLAAIAVKYQSDNSDWLADDALRCAGFAMSGPQYPAYQWQRRSATAGSVVALADLEGDGVPDHRFSASVDCASPSSCRIGPVVENQAAFRGGLPAYPGQGLLE